MIELSDITIDKKDFIQSFLNKKTGNNSEFSFTNLFMWRKSYNIRYSIIDDMLCLFPQHTGYAPTATFPIGFINSDGSEKDVSSAVSQILEWFEAQECTPMISLYDKRAVKKLNDTFPGKFSIREDRDNFDYVYKIDDLINLSGKKYHSKRNHINKFNARYPNYQYFKITSENAEKCISLFDSWRNLKEDEASVGLSEEREAVIELLNNLDVLGVTGGGIKIDGKIAAFSFGEALYDDTVVIHLEHADTSYDGIFPAINQQFLKNEWSSYTYVNREEDMGISGMRKAKKSYHPTFMVEKYIATPA